MTRLGSVCQNHAKAASLAGARHPLGIPACGTGLLWSPKGICGSHTALAAEMGVNGAGARAEALCPVIHWPERLEDAASLLAGSTHAGVWVSHLTLPGSHQHLCQLLPVLWMVIIA